MTNNTQRDPSTNTNDRDQQKNGQQGGNANQSQNSYQGKSGGSSNSDRMYQQGGAADHHGLSAADTRSSES